MIATIAQVAILLALLWAFGRICYNQGFYAGQTYSHKNDRAFHERQSRRHAHSTFSPRPTGPFWRN